VEHRPQSISLIFLLGISTGWLAGQSRASEPQVVPKQAEPSFEQFVQRSDHAGGTTSGPPFLHDSQSPRGYPSDQYVIGMGQGDLAKGPIVCQRVSELSARTDLAKQIRIFVKEHMVDRIRERSGTQTDQDIELTREEIVQEYLQGVRIVDHHIDVDKNICSATAVMPKRQLQPAGPPSAPPPAAPIMR
jgi:hypothetical protein